MLYTYITKDNKNATYKSNCYVLKIIQVYLLLSCCPCEGRISGIVDAPNACATLAIPTAIFDQVNI
jgi:acetamidase/formamidase